MKAILEFNLDDTDDSMAHKRCIKALDMAVSIFEIKYNVRGLCNNYLDANPNATVYDLLEKVFDCINDEFGVRNINIDELIN
jgi:hypothetical protein